MEAKLKNSKVLLQSWKQTLDMQVRANRISDVTRGTYENNLSRIVEAFIRKYSDAEILAIVRQSTSKSKTNAETQRVIRLLRELTQEIKR